MCAMNEIEVERRLTENEQRSKSNTHQIEEIKKRQDNLDDLVKSVAELASEQGHMKDDITEIKDDVKTLASKPGRLWDGLMDKLIFAAAGAVIAWVAAGMPGL